MMITDLSEIIFREVKLNGPRDKKVEMAVKRLEKLPHEFFAFARESKKKIGILFVKKSFVLEFKEGPFNPAYFDKVNEGVYKKNKREYFFEHDGDYYCLSFRGLGGLH